MTVNHRVGGSSPPSGAIYSEISNLKIVYGRSGALYIAKVDIMTQNITLELKGQGESRDEARDDLFDKANELILRLEDIR